MSQQKRDADLTHQLEIFTRGGSTRLADVEALLPKPLGQWSQTDVGHVKINPFTPESTLQIRLESGRKIRLESLHQFPSYTGILEGTTHPFEAIETALSQAKRYFPNVNASPVLLMPRLRVGSYHEGNDLEYWQAVPSYCSIGLFECQEPVDDGDYSWALVIWFQNEMGLSLHETNEAELARIDWNTIAEDGYY